MTGRFLGAGPTMENFLDRITIDKTPSPAMVAQVVHGAVAGTTLYEEPIMQGDRETIQRRKRSIGETNASHQPGYVMESRQRKNRGRPRKIHFTDVENTKNVQTIEDSAEENINEDVNENMSVDHTQEVLETNVKKEEWALRRTPTHCQRKCLAINCCRK